MEADDDGDDGGHDVEVLRGRRRRTAQRLIKERHQVGGHLHRQPAADPVLLQRVEQRGREDDARKLRRARHEGSQADEGGLALGAAEYALQACDEWFRSITISRLVRIMTVTSDMYVSLYIYIYILFY